MTHDQSQTKHAGYTKLKNGKIPPSQAHLPASPDSPDYNDELAKATVGYPRRVMRTDIRRFLDPETGIYFYEGMIGSEIVLVRTIERFSTRWENTLLRSMLRELRTIKLQRHRQKDYRDNNIIATRMKDRAAYRKAMGYGRFQGYAPTK
jgi:hypothetical protein